MSQTATAPTPGFRPGMRPADLGPSTDTRLDRALSRVQGVVPAALERLLGREPEAWAEDLRWNAQVTTRYYEDWQDEKAEAIVDGVEAHTGHRLNQGAQGIIGLAIGIMATLMIGVVVLGEIDSFTPSLSTTWSNTADNVSDQSQQTFNFLNLVPFLVVALFVLGLMMSRM